MDQTDKKRIKTDISKNINNRNYEMQNKSPYKNGNRKLSGSFHKKMIAILNFIIDKYMILFYIIPLSNFINYFHLSRKDIYSFSFNLR